MCVCMCVWARACQDGHVETRGQLRRVSSLPSNARVLGIELRSLSGCVARAILPAPALHTLTVQSQDGLLKSWI